MSFDRLLRPLGNRIAAMIGRAVLAAVDDSKGLQVVQLELLADEVDGEAEVLRQYGFTSHPHPDAEAVALFPNGTRSHAVVIAVDDRRFRLKGLQRGEVALYDDLGQAVILKRDRIEVVSPAEVLVQAPKVVVKADQAVIDSADVRLGGAGANKKVALVGDAVAGGVIQGPGASRVKAV